MIVEDKSKFTKIPNTLTPHHDTVRKEKYKERIKRTQFIVVRGMLYSSFVCIIAAVSL